MVLREYFYRGFVIVKISNRGTILYFIENDRTLPFLSYGQAKDYINYNYFS